MDELRREGLLKRLRKGRDPIMTDYVTGQIDEEREGKRREVRYVWGMVS